MSKHNRVDALASTWCKFLAANWALDFHSHLAPKVLLRKDSGGSQLGTTLTKLDFVLPLRGGFRVSIGVGGLVWLSFSEVGVTSPLIWSRINWRPFLTMMRLSGSTGKPKKSPLGVGSTDRQ